MFLAFLRARRWPTLLGYVLFIGMMASGYFYNVTFIQLGLTDLSRRVVGLSEQQTALIMAALALIALLAALVFGYWMMRTGRSASFSFKLRVAVGVVTVQTLLTLVSTSVASPAALITWVSLAGLALGLGMPATFSLTVDLIPRPDRGMVAGIITALAYFASNAFSSDTWTIDYFRGLSLWMMLPGTAAMVVLVFLPHRFALGRMRDALAQQHLQPEFAVGRLLRPAADGSLRSRRSLAGLLLMMFGVYFVDSLGFLRLLDTPLYMRFAWQSVALNIHLFIAVTHVIAALAGGILYGAVSERQLFGWVFAFFALAQMLYTFHTRFGAIDYAPLAMPMLYAIAVSLYTVINFAIWADVATPQNISFYAALGVAFSSWAATFISTALAIFLQNAGISFQKHFEIVNAVSLSFFLLLVLLPYLQGLFSRLPAHREVSE